MHPLFLPILSAWRRLQPLLLNNPPELQRRLARHEQKHLSRPPRPWCLAIRASDHRLDNLAESTLPFLPSSFRLHPSRIQPHDLTITADTLLRLNAPINISREDAAVIAQLLGCSPNSLRRARYQRRFHTNHVPLLSGKPGRPIPILEPGSPLHPNNPLRLPHDTLWPSPFPWSTSPVPQDFRQTLHRLPAFRPAVAANPDLRRPSPSFHLPPPAPDPVWYKWKNGVYIGDPRSNRKRPRPQSQIKNRRSKMTGSLLFHGWRFLCPKCQKPKPTLFLPLSPLALLPPFPVSSQQRTTDHGQLTLACHQCHRIRNTSLLEKDGWNSLISHLSSGLLYGHEVPKPEGLTPQRKRPYCPATSRPSPRRDQVLHLLLSGHPIPQIAATLHISRRRVHQHIKSLCDQERVPDRHALAVKLHSPHAHLHAPHQQKNAQSRRAQVQSLLLQGLTPKQIATRLNLPRHIVNYDAHVIYKANAVHSREELAAKLVARATSP